MLAQSSKPAAGTCRGRQPRGSPPAPPRRTPAGRRRPWGSDFSLLSEVSVSQWEVVVICITASWLAGAVTAMASRRAGAPLGALGQLTGADADVEPGWGRWGQAGGLRPPLLPEHGLPVSPGPAEAWHSHRYWPVLLVNRLVTCCGEADLGGAVEATLLRRLWCWVKDRFLLCDISSTSLSFYTYYISFITFLLKCEHISCF